MSQPLAYVDTSALMKRFVTEDRTAEMEAFALDNEYRLAISSLTVAEFRSVLKRRLRMGTVDAPFVTKATEQLAIEIASSALAFQAIDAGLFNLAGDLIERLNAPLGTLDALHLACAKTARCTLMVSADKQLLRAAREAELSVLDLSSPP
jgi:predicted nucleic acid-binding protein